MIRYILAYILLAILVLWYFRPFFLKFYRPRVYPNFIFPCLQNITSSWSLIEQECRALGEKQLHDLGSSTDDYNQPEKMEKFLKTLKNKEPAWFSAWNTGGGKDGWLNFALINNNKVIYPGKCPHTIKLLKETNLDIFIAGFSKLKGKAVIKPHTDTGMNTGLVALHLGLNVPDDCYMLLGESEEKLNYREGKSFVFDQAYKHSVYNNSDDDRIILLLEFKLSSIPIF